MMKNNQSKGLRSFMKEKGYYIVLLLCAVAVSVSGYFLISGKESSVPRDSSAVSTGESEPVTPSVKDVVATGEPQGTTQEEQRLLTVAPVSGESIHPFSVDALSYNETTRDWRTHEGVDLRAAAGEAVCAAMDGTVHAIYEDASLGMTVVLRHAGEYTTHYSNLDEAISLKVGDRVKVGDQLGTVGVTALVEMASEPHLHFAVYHNNVPIDPLQFIAEYAQ